MEKGVLPSSCLTVTRTPSTLYHETACRKEVYDEGYTFIKEDFKKWLISLQIAGKQSSKQMTSKHSATGSH